MASRLSRYWTAAHPLGRRSPESSPSITPVTEASLSDLLIKWGV